MVVSRRWSCDLIYHSARPAGRAVQQQPAASAIARAHSRFRCLELRERTRALRCSMLTGHSPRSPSFDLAHHDRHTRTRLPLSVSTKMTSPAPAASSATAHDAHSSTTTAAVVAPSSKSSLAYILTGDHASDDDDMDERHALVDDQQHQINPHFPIAQQQQQHYDHREQAQHERHSVHYDLLLTTERYSVQTQYAPPSLPTVHSYRYPPPQSYAVAAVQRVPVASFPLESQFEPPLKQFSAADAAASQPQARKKVRSLVPSELRYHSHTHTRHVVCCHHRREASSAWSQDAAAAPSTRGCAGNTVRLV